MKDSWFHPDRIGTYKGEMKNGLAHGKGTYTSSHKGKKGNYKYLYKGSFVNGLKHGKGTQIIHLPTYVLKYQGGFKNDVPHGRGISIYKYKGKLEQKYIGEYKNGYIHGKGKMINYFEKWIKQGRFVKGGFKK
jgi:hypothetical protein